MRRISILAPAACAFMLGCARPQPVSPGPAVPPADPAPVVIASASYEDFEGYGGLLTESPWPRLGGWMRGPYGLYPHPALDPVIKAQGDYSLRIDYRTGPMRQVALSRLYEPSLVWEGYDAIQMWLVPDGSGRRFVFFVLEALGPDRKKWFWEAGYDMVGTAPVIVTMPFAAFRQASDTPDATKTFDWRRIYETVFWVRAGDDEGRPTGRGSGPRNPQRPSSIWVDDLRLVKLQRPLDRVVAHPAPPRLAPEPIEDGALRVDYGADADWVDHDRHLWRADVPATQGIWHAASFLPITGTDLPHLYRTQRREVKHLKLPVAKGRWAVALHFAELDAAVGPGERVFRVHVEDQVSFDVDVRAEAGAGGAALVRHAEVEVADGTLDVTFAPTKGHTMLSAIEVARR
jgi:hypothetical protein